MAKSLKSGDWRKPDLQHKPLDALTPLNPGRVFPMFFGVPSSSVSNRFDLIESYQNCLFCDALCRYHINFLQLFPQEREYSSRIWEKKMLLSQTVFIQHELSGFAAWTGILYTWWVLKDGIHGVELQQGGEGTELLYITSHMTALNLSVGKRKDTSSDGIIQAWPLALFRIKMSIDTYFQEFCPRSPQRRALFSGRGQSGSAGCLSVSSLWIPAFCTEVITIQNKCPF